MTEEEPRCVVSPNVPPTPLRLVDIFRRISNEFDGDPLEIVVTADASTLSDSSDAGSPSGCVARNLQLSDEFALYFNQR